MNANVTPGVKMESAAGGHRTLLLGCCLLLAGVLWAYLTPLTGLVHRWNNEPDYSHGFLVPVFSFYLLWLRRQLLPARPAVSRWSLITGMLVFLTGLTLRLVAIRYQYRLLEPISLVPVLAGLLLMVGGWKAMHWAWPALIFLFFMVPLPGFISTLLSHPLQRISTICSTFSLQTIGVPAVAQGNVIWLSEAKIGVVEACSGLRMLNVFLALAVGCSFLVDRPLWQKSLLVLSTPLIGVISNVIRITATGLAHEYVGAEFADKLFHDFAGWLMMPFAIAMLSVELFLLQRLLVDAEAEFSIPLNRVKTTSN